MQKKIYLCQYAVTGEMEYAAYCEKNILCEISSYVVPNPPVFIENELGKFKSEFDYDITLIPGVKRKIYNMENEMEFAFLQWVDHDSYSMEIGTEKVDILCCGDCFTGFVWGDKIFDAKLIPKEEKHMVKFEKSGYEMTRMYEVCFEGEVSREMQVLIMAFPMLKFGF